MITLEKLVMLLNSYEIEMGVVGTFILAFAITLCISIIVQTLIIKPIQKLFENLFGIITRKKLKPSGT